MRVVISSGHGKYVRGARGDPVPPQVDEVDEARKIVNRVADYLDDAEVDVEVFHDDTSHDVSDNLDTIVEAHNDAGPHDLDVSVHLNCYDHSAHGCEVLYTSDAGKAIAGPLSAAISAAGDFTNRGPKERGDLAFLNNTNETAVLIETFFCDNTDDCNKYREHFDDICRAIAASISGQSVGEPPPEGERPPPDRPDWPDRPENIPLEDRPTLRRGDEGPHVLDMQRMIPRFSGMFDGDFGPTTEENVLRYQRSRGLDADGICGQQTWTALYEHKLPVPPPPPPPGALTNEQQIMVMRIANDSQIADYSWDDRGVAPTGFTQGMALSFAQTWKKLRAGHAAALSMSKARTNSDKDVFNIYREEFDDLGMSNEEDGVDTLRHLYAFMIGSGMRESSGQHCCGRDQSADNVSSDTCEAGAFQTSFNAHSASEPEFSNLMDEYALGRSPGYLEAFSEGVSCSADDWENYGSGIGAQFQDMCKTLPAFSAETHALTLRHLSNHYGPVNRGEVELRKEADTMLRAVQTYMEETEPVA